LSDIVAELRVTLLGWKAYFGVAEVLSLCARSTKGYDASYAVTNGSNGDEQATGNYAEGVYLCAKHGTLANRRMAPGGGVVAKMPAVP
jgi:hypothetical protein